MHKYTESQNLGAIERLIERFFGTATWQPKN